MAMKTVPAAHGGVGAIQGPEQGALQPAAQLGAREFQVAPGGGIELDEIAVALGLHGLDMR